MADNIRSTSDIRGVFSPYSTGTVFLRVSDFEGNGRSAESISISIVDSSASSVIAGTPELVDKGFYAFDWTPDTQPSGEYTAQWTYAVDGEEYTEDQAIIVSADGDNSRLYSGRIVEMRQALSAMITHAQAIPVYREPAKKSRDRRTFEFTFPRWNQSAGARIFRNGNIVTSGFTINYFKGTVTFDNALTPYDRIEGGYNFRWYSDEQIDRFLSNATHLLNIWPPVTGYGLPNLDEKWIVIVLYGAAVDAIRNLMLSLQFQEPQLVFGGADRAEKVFSNLEAIKKNYEETWNKALEQKKNGPYKGLTRFVSGQQFAMPGGRARWFRNMFSNGSGT